jgi:hypothetical protein
MVLPNSPRLVGLFGINIKTRTISAIKHIIERQVFLIGSTIKMGDKIVNEQMLHGVVCAIIASFGAIARFMYQKEEEPICPFDIISLCLVASFTGVMIYFVSSYYEFQTNLTYLLSGISGWVGPQILDSISNVVLKKTGLGNITSLPNKSDFHCNEEAEK